MKAFVSGATGFLGVTLIQELCKKGWEVYALRRTNSDVRELEKLGGVKLVLGDVTDADSLERVMPEDLDVVFHAAAAVGFLAPGLEEQQYRTNVIGTRNMIGAARMKRARRFVLTSTILVYDFSGGQIITEATPMNGAESASSYIRTKALADIEVDQAVETGLNAVTLHPSLIFGAYDKNTWSILFKEFARGFRLPGMPPGKASCCHMRQVALAHVAAAERGQAGAHYVLGGPDHSLLEIGQEIAAILGKPKPRYAVPAWLFRALGRVEPFVSRLMGKVPLLTPEMADVLCEVVVCSSDKAIRELGYQPVSLREMLLDCHEWMLREGLLPRA